MDEVVPILVDAGFRHFRFDGCYQLAVGLELEIDKIRDLARRKCLLPGLLFGQMLLLPPIALLVIRIVPTPDGMEIVVLLLSVCPIGNIANFLHLARGRQSGALRVRQSLFLLAGSRRYASSICPLQ